MPFARGAAALDSRLLLWMLLVRAAWQDCREFKAGRCSRGESCRFNHVGGPSTAPPEGSFDDRRFDDEAEEAGGRSSRYDDNENDRAYDEEEDVRPPPLASSRTAPWHVDSRHQPASRPCARVPVCLRCVGMRAACVRACVRGGVPSQRVDGDGEIPTDDVPVED